MSGFAPKFIRYGFSQAYGFQLPRQTLRQVEAKSPEVARGSPPEEKARGLGPVGFIDTAKSPSVVVSKERPHVPPHDVEIR